MTRTSITGNCSSNSNFSKGPVVSLSKINMYKQNLVIRTNYVSELSIGTIFKFKQLEINQQFVPSRQKVNYDHYGLKFFETDAILKVKISEIYWRRYSEPIF